MKVICKKFEDLTNHELYEILKLRSEIFVVEQKCIYLDLDGNDYKCLHLYLFDESKHDIVAYCRVIPKGITFESASIGRVITNAKYRKQSYARELLTNAINIIKNDFKESVITIGAQNYLKDFYASFGFTEISNIYDEDGILHVDMRLELQ